MSEDLNKKVELNEKEAEQTSGGFASYSDWVWGTVHGVVDYGPGSDSKLTLRTSPGGDILYQYGWQNGDSIYVNRGDQYNGWIRARSNDGSTLGWVNRNYVWC